MKKNGFTLIELLIVIVIIGILAGVMIVIISPNKQMNQANDGTITAMINKIILTTESFNSAYARAPNEAAFLAALDANTVEFGSECTITGTADNECIFSINGIALPAVCDSNGWTNTGTDPCNFRYKANIQGDPARFRLYVRSSGIANTLFTFDSKQGGEVMECPLNILDSQDITSVCR